VLSFLLDRLEEDRIWVDNRYQYLGGNPGIDERKESKQIE